MLADFEHTLASGGTVSFYGQFNPAIISGDHGEETETNVLDNDLSVNCVGVHFAMPTGENTFRFRFETGLGLPNSTEVDQFGSDYRRFTRERIRHFDFSLEGGWGQVSLGHGSMSADGAAETDLSYVGTALYSFNADANPSFIFRDTSGVLTGPTVGDTTSNFDGTRRGRIRYDTASFNGFSLSAAYAQNILNQDDEADYYDVAVRYSGQISDGTELAAPLAYQARDRDDGDRSDLVASGSLLLENGFSFTAAVGDRDNDGGSDPNYTIQKSLMTRTG